MSRRRKRATVGADSMTPGLRQAVSQALAGLRAAGLAPAAVVLDWDVVTLIYPDAETEKIADALVPDPILYDGRRYRFNTATAPRPEVGAAAMSQRLRDVVEQFTERLKEQHLTPAEVKIDDPQHVTFWFWTQFRADQAADALPGSYKIGAYMLYVRTKVIPAAGADEAAPDAAVGQVVGDAQSTPWTCGPAALRAVLAHHGLDVSEDEVAQLAGNVPVLGVRPTGLVKAATQLGFRADLFQLKNVAALAPFLAADLPVMVVVDSWTQPGKAGHWVVVTGVGPSQVKVMDPHVAGNWRTLTPAELDARWWNREPGGRVAKRLALVVSPAGDGASDDAGDDGVEVGGQSVPDPKTGRTAHAKGVSKALVTFAKVAQAVAKAVVTFYTGGAGGKAYDKLLDKTGASVAGLTSGEKAKWFNEASNPDLYTWTLANWRDKLAAAYAPDADKHQQRDRQLYEALGIGPDSYRDLRHAMIPALKASLAALSNGSGNAYNQHMVQAILILFYGGLQPGWDLVKTACEKKPKFDLGKPEGISAFAGWVNRLVEVLEPYRVIAEGQDNPNLEFA